MAAARVWWRLEDVPSDFGPCALTIGNFDGVHTGHRVLLQRASSIAAAHAWKAAVLTFQPHPARVVAPTRAPRMITSFPRRAELMADEGIEEVLVLPFTDEVSLWTPEKFVQSLLVERLGAKAVVVGEDFRFGHKQAGDRHLLEDLGAKYGFEVSLVAPVNTLGERASSSLVRELAGSGDVARAARVLSKPFELQGRVVAGQGIGSRQTVPTLNLEPDSEVLPLNGVYATRTSEIDGARQWDSITNVGMRPTFNGDSLTIETFLLSRYQPPAPALIRIEFLRRIRDERKFDSPEALKAQIGRDVQRAQIVHSRLRPFHS